MLLHEGHSLRHISTLALAPVREGHVKTAWVVQLSHMAYGLGLRAPGLNPKPELSREPLPSPATLNMLQSTP